jgi:PleD family two-component response regulator
MSKRLLIIDDDPFITTLYEAKLQKEGLTVEIASDGEDALKKLQNFQPDILLLDLQMPKINGIQVLTYIRAHPQLKDIPVIIFSNAATDNLVQQAWSAGATKFLTKNQCSPNDLVLEVRHTLKTGSPEPQEALSEVTPVQDWPTEPHEQKEIHKEEPVKKNAPPAKAAEARPQAKTTAEPPPKAQTEPPPPPISTAPVPEVDPSVPALLQAFLRSQEVEEQKEKLLDLYQLIQPQLKAARHTDRLTRQSQTGKALEKLFEYLYEFPEHINPSACSTLSQGLELLTMMFSKARSDRRPVVRPLMVLVVCENEAATRKTVEMLENAYIRTLSVNSAEAAGALIKQNPFDLVFFHLDNEMIDYELCDSIRATEPNKLTPTLWALPEEIYNIVPAASLVGVNDIISTPLREAELPLKVLGLVLRTL